MSHFTVLVCTKEPGEAIDRALEPFDENLDTPKYMKYTRQQLIDYVRGEDQRYEASDLYRRWLTDKKAYVLDMIERSGSREPSWAHLGYLISEFPKRLKWTDEQYFEWAIRDYEPHERDEQGNVYSTYNPNSKWDWYQVGGRWNGGITLKEGAEGKLGDFSWGWSAEERAEILTSGLNVSQALAGDVDWEATGSMYAFLGLDGEWIGRGEMGWFGMSDEEDGAKDKWPAKFRELVDALPADAVVTLVDCHI